VIGNLASQLIMLKVRPSILLPSVEFIWSILVMGMAGAKNLNTLLILRFFIGLLEASAFPGILTLLGNWYKPEELGKRSSIFIATSAAGSMFSGYLQSGLYSGMDGKYGLAAWRWLMIFDGIIGIPVSLFGFFAIPDSPTNTRALWLNARDREIAKARMEEVGHKPPSKLTWKIVKESLGMWPMWLFPLAFACHVLGIRVYSYFNIYLKSTGQYSVQQVNDIPTAGYAYQILIALVYAWVSDYYQTRWWVVCVACLMTMIGTIVLSVYPEHNTAAMLAGWILTFGETGCVK
jgi:MFS transporter, ACS family, pantothenate transporter